MFTPLLHVKVNNQIHTNPVNCYLEVLGAACVWLFSPHKIQLHLTQTPILIGVPSSIYFSLLSFLGVVAASKPILANFLHYGKVELIPPKPSEFGAIKDGIAHVVHQAKSGGWKNLTVKVNFY